MESPIPTASEAPAPRAVAAYSAGAVLLWLCRRPLLLLTALLLRVALALLKPSLLVLGLVKLFETLRAAAETSLPPSAASRPMVPMPPNLIAETSEP